MSGGPVQVGGGYSICANSGIASFEFIPVNLKVLNISYTGIKSLIGISDHFTTLVTLAVNRNQIESGGLGLIIIEKFKLITENSAMVKPTWMKIIEKYLGTDNIIECQSELIEAGYEEYAVL